VIVPAPHNIDPQSSERDQHISVNISEIQCGEHSAHWAAFCMGLYNPKTPVLALICLEAAEAWYLGYNFYNTFLLDVPN